MKGRLIYVIGASGSGKDTLIKAAATALAEHSDIRFARRCITRPSDPDGENHLPMSRDAFNARAQQGLFAMQWSGNGHDYGIGIEINTWLNNRNTVVVNGSRQWLAQAFARYPGLVPVLIEVSTSVLRQRLQKRGRESAAEIEARLRRHQQIQSPIEHCIVINNDGALSEASRAFIEVIRQPVRGTALCR
ncbi:phosphonate metabolism protein/1,5-bisphosphokinase (PRPP-forming) PhnN [Marinobacter nauticus]|jgi:ribose 1,5-bisphosphokinase|uniref:Ribose 1,5-bisphosphate phosphokinase PhnN n=1 Tax=Marinobacter nauticus (strain ATCC 700491 / DSM 11845 / VT8) TaxID=351348 RepID=A1U304_MARN8|nr:phosphonate metabolism protein/1,5-bisphosphokinase (PRPP-forming) PhnN [Marinobacter nauticus]ABM19373.1 phosphonate metabolism protein/1,5-bisphosphokinase (PRPP-forming) PhnN [Marinobacter nauticus VT8]